MLEEGAKKSKEYWEVYKETPLQDALDPAKGILAFPPPPFPTVEPAPWMQAPAEARLAAGMAAASKPLDANAQSALVEASARAEWVEMNNTIAALAKERAEASILDQPGRRRPASADPRSLLQRSAIEVPQLDGSSIFAQQWNPGKSIYYPGIGEPRLTSPRFPGPRSAARRRPATAQPSRPQRRPTSASRYEPEPEQEPLPAPSAAAAVGRTSLYELSEMAPPASAEMVDITSKGDGGVLRWTMRDGDRQRPLPYEGAGLAIQYVGRLSADGAMFDQSTAGKPLRITLGAGQVISSWEVALRTMRWGECTLFRCAPEYAYGKNGFKGVIPPSATLDFYIELIGWEPELRWCSVCSALFEGAQCLKQYPDDGGCDPDLTAGRYKKKMPPERIRAYWKENPHDGMWYNCVTSATLSAPPENVHDQEEQRWLGEPPPLQAESQSPKKKSNQKPSPQNSDGAVAGHANATEDRPAMPPNSGTGASVAAAFAAMGKPGSSGSSGDGTHRGGMAGVAAGMTTLKAVTKLKRAITPYYLQSNPKFDTSSAKELREELRDHPQVVGAIDRLWTSITGYGKFLQYTGFVEKDPYVLLSIQVQKAVMEPDVFDEDLARKTAEDEWNSDSVEIDGVQRIDHAGFHKALFELADIWTPEISPGTYSAFLWKLTQRITFLRVVVYEGLYDRKSFDNTQFFELRHNKAASKAWAGIREKSRDLPTEVYYMMKQTVAEVDSMQDPDAELAFTDPHLYSKAEQRVQDLRIAVHEDASRFGWLDKTKQHKLPTVLNSAARSFNVLPPSSALGFPFAAPNNSAKQSQAGEVQRVALWKAKLSQVKDVEALQRLADARKAKRGSGSANRTSPTFLGRMGVSDAEGVGARPRPWKISKSAPKSGMKGWGDRGGEYRGDRNTDASTGGKTEATSTDAKAGLIAPAAVVSGADKSSRPLRRPRPVVSRQLGGNPGSGDQRRSFSRPLKTAQSPANVSVEEPTVPSQGRGVTSAGDEEPSIMSDMIRSESIKDMDTSKTDAQIRRKIASNAAQDVTQRSFTSTAAGIAAADVARLQRKQRSKRQSPAKPEPEPAAIDVVAESAEEAPELQPTAERSSDPQSATGTTVEPVPEPEATLEPSAEKEPGTESTVAPASEPEATSDRAPEPETVTEAVVGWQPQHPSATSLALGEESGHDRWEEFDFPGSSDDDNAKATRDGPSALLSKPGQQTPTAKKDEEQAKREAGWTHVYKYPQTVHAAAADQSTASLPAPDPMQGYTAARRRLRQWEGGGSRSRQQQRRRPLSASGGSAGLLRLTRRSKSYEVTPGATASCGGMRSVSPEARAYSRSSTMLTACASGSFGPNSFDRPDRKASPPRRIAIYT